MMAACTTATKRTATKNLEMDMAKFVGFQLGSRRPRKKSVLAFISALSFATGKGSPVLDPRRVRSTGFSSHGIQNNVAVFTEIGTGRVLSAIIGQARSTPLEEETPQK